MSFFTGSNESCVVSLIDRKVDHISTYISWIRERTGQAHSVQEHENALNILTQRIGQVDNSISLSSILCDTEELHSTISDELIACYESSSKLFGRLYPIKSTNCYYTRDDRPDATSPSFVCGAKVQGSHGNHGAFGLVTQAILVPGPQSSNGIARVAVKSMMNTPSRADPLDIRRRILREANIWNNLKHDNIVPFLGVFGLDDSSDHLHLVSQWVASGNAVLFLNGPSDNPGQNRTNYAGSLIKDVLKGLEFLHLKGYAHGDLKPDNFVVRGLNAPRGLICDFGLSSLYLTAALDLQMVATLVGCLYYLAPEIIRLDQTDDKEERRSLLPKADIYSMGLSAHQMLTGRIPFCDVPDNGQHSLTQFHQLQFLAKLGEVGVDPEQSSVFMEKHAPQPNDKVDDCLYKLLRSCWSPMPQDRPFAKGLLASYCKLG